MAQQLLTGNLLQDGITYHASDINAAINNAILLPGAISSNRFVGAGEDHKILGLTTANELVSTNLASVKTLSNTNISSTGFADFRDGISFSGLVSATVSTNQNNWSPTGGANATVISITATGSPTITGMLAGFRIGTFKVLYCKSGTLTIARESASSDAANRFFWPSASGNMTLTDGQTATFMYFDFRWVQLARSGGF